MNGGEHVAEVLRANRVEFLFTLCGGHISPILAAARACGLRIVDTRHEATAVFAADAVARLTGRPGVVAVTAGPGLTNTITALKNAQLAQSPLLLLGGAAPTALQGRGALQDIDQRALIAPHVKHLVRVRRVRDLAPAVEDGLRRAVTGIPGPVFVECPVDLLYDEALIRQWYADAAGKGTAFGDRVLRWYLNRHARRMFAGHDLARDAAQVHVAPARGAEGALARAANALARAERPLIVIGSQALLLASEARDIADAVTRLQIPVYLSGMARGLLGPEHPLQMRHARRTALREADCVLLAGVPCDFRLDYGRHVRRSATLIAANRSAAEARLNRRPDIAVIGDAGLTLLALSGRSTPDVRIDWLERLRDRDTEREHEIDAQAAASGEFINPVALFRMLNSAAAEGAVMVADGGDFVATASYIMRPRGPLSWLDPGAFGTLGVGAGFALGAQLVRPGDEVWLLWGDGASGYGLVEFDTFVRHGVPVIGIVGNDASWAQIAREQVKMLNDDVGTVLARSAYHAVAEGFGAVGIEVKTMDQVPAALQQAREAARAGRPVLVNVWLDRTDFREGSISM
jgi:thiamine pyrophosphate-dependent acetolactate synthase large subunit-like protein